jgi:hypothetical protein
VTTRARARSPRPVESRRVLAGERECITEAEAFAILADGD